MARTRIVGNRPLPFAPMALLIVTGMTSANPRPPVHAGADVNTQRTVQAYLDRLTQKSELESLLAG